MGSAITGQQTGTAVMRTAFISVALAVAFLGAGALGSDNRAPLLQSASYNVTVVTKNQAWPVKDQMVLDICSHVRCIDI